MENKLEAPGKHGRIIRLKHLLFNDHFQNYKQYATPKAQLVLADIPYNLSTNAFASSPEWYLGGGGRMFYFDIVLMRTAGVRI